MGRVEYPTGKVLAPADYVTASEGFTLRTSSEPNYVPKAPISKYHPMEVGRCFARSFTFILGSKDLLTEETTHHRQ